MLPYANLSCNAEPLLYLGFIPGFSLLLLDGFFGMETGQFPMGVDVTLVH